jgi:hypothetical protein
MSKPPEKAAKHNEGDRSKKKNQRRFLDPGDRWNRKRHEESEGAYLPGEAVNASDKGSKGQEKENGKTGRISAQHPSNVRNKQEIHGRQKSTPVKNLRPDEPDAIGSAVGVPPSGQNTQDSRNNREDLQ